MIVFLTGQNEIEKACDLLLDARDSFHDVEIEMSVLPLYGALQEDLQSRIFEAVPTSVRKVIVATNIAETSLTVDDVKYVVDSGFVKQKV